jgi:uncharacterized membrane protein YdbT with pleckstrin-like domain
MSYVSTVLQPGEAVIRTGRLHWITYGKAILVLIVGCILLWFEYAQQFDRVIIAVTALLAALVCLFFLLQAWVVQWTTEFAVTDRRIIYKRGFINRHTAEMHMDKVESVKVDQSILGRILGYGTLRVLGIGQGIEDIRRIASPLELRSAITAR